MFFFCYRDSTLCVAKNLYFHLPTLAHAQDNMIIVPPEGVIGGFCEVDEDMVQRETNVKRSLSSWYYVRHYFLFKITVIYY